jgi:hypothetical protein
MKLQKYLFGLIFLEVLTLVSYSHHPDQDQRINSIPEVKGTYYSNISFVEVKD